VLDRGHGAKRGCAGARFAEVCELDGFVISQAGRHGKGRRRDFDLRDAEVPCVCCVGEGIDDLHPLMRSFIAQRRFWQTTGLITNVLFSRKDSIKWNISLDKITTPV
jgi:hypothetical protein